MNLILLSTATCLLALFVVAIYVWWLGTWWAIRCHGFERTEMFFCTYRCRREHEKDMFPFQRLNKNALEILKYENSRVYVLNNSFRWQIYFRYATKAEWPKMAWIIQCWNAPELFNENVRKKLRAKWLPAKWGPFLFNDKWVRMTFFGWTSYELEIKPYNCGTSFRENLKINFLTRTRGSKFGI